MFCGFCGKKIPDGSEFCGFCGKSLVDIEPAHENNEAQGKQENEYGYGTVRVNPPAAIPAAGVSERTLQGSGYESNHSDGAAYPDDYYGEYGSDGTVKVKRPVNGGVQDDSVGEGASPGGYDIYNKYNGTMRVTPPDIDGGSEPYLNDYPGDDRGNSGKKSDLRNKKKNKSTAVACIVLSVFMCLFVIITALSGIARYVTKDSVIKTTVIENGFDDYPVNTGESEMSLTEFLCDIIEKNGKDLGFKRRDVNKLLKEESIKEYFADVFVDYKDDLFKGTKDSKNKSKIGQYNCGDIAEWMYNNADTVKKITGVTVDAKARDQLKEGLQLNTLNLGSNNFKDLFGVDRGLATFFMSSIFFYISLVLCVGLAILIFISADFDFRFFLSCVGVVFLVAGIILLAFFGFIMIAGSGSGFLSSTLTSATLMPFVIVCGASVLLGVLFEVIYYLTGKKRRYR